jgi:hypothetical protein
MPHVDDLLGFASVAAASLATAVVLSSAGALDPVVNAQRASASTIVHLQPVHVVARRSTEVARTQPDEVANCTRVVQAAVSI